MTHPSHVFSGSIIWLGQASQEEASEGNHLLKQRMPQGATALRSEAAIRPAPHSTPKRMFLARCLLRRTEVYNLKSGQLAIIDAWQDAVTGWAAALGWGDCIQLHFGTW